MILECISNAKGDKIGKIKVKGVLLSKILEKSKPLKNSKEVVFRSFDADIIQA
jgi:DMSO/TMAO reductase YedYZ molybdopterin-dependent catalytic subunit